MFLDFLKPFVGIIEKVIPDPKQAAEIKLKMFEMAQNGELEELRQDTEIRKERSAIIQAETKSDSWLTKSWRPLLMLSFGFIIIYTKVIAPQLNAMGFNIVIPVIEEQFWSLLNIAIGGYIGGRSIQKTAQHISEAIKK